MCYFGDSSGSVARHEVACKNRVNRHQSTGSSCGLPGWLLTCRQIPDEGLEQFRRRATWIIWPVFTDGSYSPDFEEMLMAPKFARSIAMPRLACENSNWEMYSPLVVGFLYFPFREVDSNWFLNFAKKPDNRSRYLEIECSLLCVWGRLLGNDAGVSVDLDLGV